MNREINAKQYQKVITKRMPVTTASPAGVRPHPVVPVGAGSDHRNHCPNCLSSLHVDDEPATVPPTRRH